MNPERLFISFKYKVGCVPVMTNLSLTSILFVSILVEEVKVFCFVSNCACNIPPLEFAIFVSILSPQIFKLEQSRVSQLKIVKKFIYLV